MTESFTTDTTESGISFIARQKQLRAIYNDFRDAFDNLQTQDSIFLGRDEKIDHKYAVSGRNQYNNNSRFNSISNSAILYDSNIYDQEIIEVLDEIRMLKAEIQGIKGSLRSRGFSSKPGMEQIFQKIDDIITILDSQRARAETLARY